MPNYCKIIVAGHLGRDPESRDVNGQTVSRFSIAVTDKSKNGENTSWFDVSAWGKTGELCQQYLAKGRAALVEGRMRSRKYEKDGQQRTAWDISADRVVFLGGGKGEQREGAAAPVDEFEFN